MTILDPNLQVLVARDTKFLVALHNNLAEKLNLPAIKSWKESKEKLGKKIMAMQEKQAEAVTKVIPPAAATGAYDKARNAPKAPAKVKSVKASKTDKPRVAAGDSELLKYLASKGFTPKTARARFRSHKVKKVDGRYVLNAEVKKALE